MSRLTRPIRVLLATLLATLVVAGCGSATPPTPDPAIGGSPAVAERMLDRWLAQVSGGSSDLGWGLIDPGQRERVYGGVDAYRASVARADWSGFRWSTDGADLRNGDYRVHVSVTGDISVIEGFLSDWGLLHTFEIHGDTYVGFVVVRIGVAGGPAGIHATE